VAEDRKQSSLDGFWGTPDPGADQRHRSRRHDMWDPYIASVRAHVPEADGKDRFPTSFMCPAFGRCVDKVRRKEQHKPCGLPGMTDWQGRATTGCGIRPPWTETPRKEFAELRNSGTENSTGLGAERDGHDPIQLPLRASGAEAFPLVAQLGQCGAGLQPMIERGRAMLKRRFENIITYLRHRITNAASESINARFNG